MSIIQRIIWFIFLLLLQVLVCNHIHILGYATPMPFIYMLIMLHTDTPRWLYIIIGFTLGLLIDLAAICIGEYSTATTFVALLTPWALSICTPAERSDEGFAPSALTMKWGGFLRYAFLVTLMECTLFFIIENFSFFHWEDLLLDIACSTLLTLLIICAMERVRISFAKK